MSNSKKSNNFFNPIDDDKITEKPNLLPYPHNVGGVVIKPTKEGKLKSKALSAMQQQTETQLNQIYKQIELLAQQAKDIQKRIEISKWIYNAEMGFEPLISETYYL